MRSFLRNPGILVWWRANPYRFTPEFREYVERLVDEKT
jgi:hypothetical protein